MACDIRGCSLTSWTEQSFPTRTHVAVARASEFVLGKGFDAACEGDVRVSLCDRNAMYEFRDRARVHGLYRTKVCISTLISQARAYGHGPGDHDDQTNSNVDGVIRVRLLHTRHDRHKQREPQLTERRY